MLYDYLKKNYAPKEPILVSELRRSGIPMNTVRQQVMRLAEAGKLKRFDTGIYYLPAPSLFKSGGGPSLMDVIDRKYLREGTDCCGYMTGVAFANWLGITTQVPVSYEIATNKAKTRYKKAKLGRMNIILRKPRAAVSAKNAKALQRLDLLKEIDLLAEIRPEECSQKILTYMRQTGLSFKDLQPYLPLYPDKIFRNLYETRLLYGVPTDDYFQLTTC